MIQRWERGVAITHFRENLSDCGRCRGHDATDLVLVQSRLGHRNIQNTMVYTRLVHWDQPDNWIVRRPQTSKKEDDLTAAGFEYFRFDDKLGIPIYRRRK